MPIRPSLTCVGKLNKLLKIPLKQGDFLIKIAFSDNIRDMFGKTPEQIASDIYDDSIRLNCIDCGRTCCHRMALDSLGIPIMPSCYEDNDSRWESLDNLLDKNKELIIARKLKKNNPVLTAFNNLKTIIETQVRKKPTTKVI